MGNDAILEKISREIRGEREKLEYDTHICGGDC